MISELTEPVLGVVISVAEGVAEEEEIGEYEYQAPEAPVWPRFESSRFKSQELITLSKLKS